MIVKTNEVYLFWQTDSTLSNWRLGTPYVLNDLMFVTSEHGLMYEKAIMFDLDSVPEIFRMQNCHPRDVKKIGRGVANFNPEVWDEESIDAIVPHLIAKAEQNQSVMEELMSTGNLIIAEASPYDRVWGIGLRPDDPQALNSKKWIGENRLGKAWMRVRDYFNEQRSTTVV